MDPELRSLYSYMLEFKWRVISVTEENNYFLVSTSTGHTSDWVMQMTPCRNFYLMKHRPFFQ